MHALVVSKIVGHSSPSITLGIYAPARLGMQEGAAAAMDEISARPGLALTGKAQVANVARRLANGPR